MACDHLNRYEEDIGLIARLGLDSYRFSVEWSRIEPHPGEFSQDALDHYARVIDSCHAHGLTAAVAFHHFTNPIWFARRGGWEPDDSPALFGRFCSVAARRLGKDIDLAITINEPNMPPLLGYQDAVFPPGRADPEARRKVTANLVRAHRMARDALRTHVEAPIGMALALADWHLVEGGEQALEEIRSLREDVFIAATEGDDFIGANTYTRHRVGPDGFMDVEEGYELTAMGYEFFPDAIEGAIRRAAAMTGLPVIVSEAGIGTDDDSRRIAFIDGVLRAIHRTLQDGIDVRGFYYWSALDNFEWHHGYAPKFGLISVDRDTQTRTVKPSGHFLGQIARSRRLPSKNPSGRDSF